MKKITMTYVTSRNTTRLECARLVDRYPDLELVPITFGSDQRNVWMALSRSDVAVVDEEVMRHDDGETMGVLLAGNPGVKFLVVMEDYNEDRMLWAISQGVRGVIRRGELLRLLGRAIKQVHQGEIWIPRNLLNSVRELINRGEVSLARVESAVINARLRLH